MNRSEVGPADSTHAQTLECIRLSRFSVHGGWMIASGRTDRHTTHTHTLACTSVVKRTVAPFVVHQGIFPGSLGWELGDG